MRSRRMHNVLSRQTAMSAKLTGALVLLLIALASGEKEAKPKHRLKNQDPFALLDHHMALALSHDHSLIPQLAHQYFWPWTELAKAVVSLDAEDALEEPHVHANTNKFEIKLDVRRFKPEEIRVKVKDRTVFVEGKHIIKDEMLNKKYVANHFLQRYALPIGCDPDEVTSVLKANGILSISAPRHKPPPPEPERLVPILIEEVEEAPVVEDARPILVEKRPEEEKRDEVRPLETRPDSEDLPMEQRPSKEKASGSSEESSGSTESDRLSPVTDPALPAETTTYAGKIRKKELKNATKDPKRNETKKPIENNVLDYANVELE